MATTRAPPLYGPTATSRSWCARRRVSRPCATVDEATRRRPNGGAYYYIIAMSVTATTLVAVADAAGVLPAQQHGVWLAGREGEDCARALPTGVTRVGAK